MGPQYFVQSLFALAGILSLLAAVLDWDWFFTAQNTQFIVRSLGRRRARWFYGVLDVVLMVMAGFFFFQTGQASAACQGRRRTHTCALPGHSPSSVNGRQGIDTVRTPP